jgi:hypothetical protein
MMLKKEFLEQYHMLLAERDVINNKISEFVNRYHEEVLERNGYKIGDQIKNDNGYACTVTGVVDAGGILYIRAMNNRKPKIDTITRIKLIEI